MRRSSRRSRPLRICRRPRSAHIWCIPHCFVISKAVTRIFKILFARGLRNTFFIRDATWAEAIAISSGRITAVGSDDDIRRRKGASTRVVALRDATTMREVTRRVAHARVAFGTDRPVVQLNPMLDIRNAVLRQSLDGQSQGGYLPEQRITVAEALRAYTLDAAYASRVDDQEGSIAIDKCAASLRVASIDKPVMGA